MSATPETEGRHKPPAWIAAIAVPLLVAFTICTFAWPTARMEPRDLPLGVAGPSAATRPLEQRLAQHGDAFELHHYADGSAARAAIEDRDIYGAVVVSPAGTALLTSSAASPLVAGLLEQAFASPENGAGSAPTVDVVPADPDDPRGGVLNSLVMPIVLASVALAGMVAVLGGSRRRQSGVLLAASAAAGLVSIGLVQGWLGAISGPWLANATVISLVMLAIASLLVGLYRLFGHVGLVLGVVTMVLVGNPWSGVSSAPELLPKPVGLIGQLLPPGAGGNLLRSTAFFDGAGAGGHLAVLLVTATLGFAGIWAGAIRRRTASQAPAVALTDATQQA
jgi:hypothetical protein